MALVDSDCVRNAAAWGLPMTDEYQAKDLSRIEQRIRELEHKLTPPEQKTARAVLARAEMAYNRSLPNGTNRDALRAEWMKALDNWNEVFSATCLPKDDYMEADSELDELRLARAKLAGEPYQEEIIFEPGTIRDSGLDEPVLIQPTASGAGEVFIKSELGDAFVWFGASAVRPTDRERIAFLDVAIAFWGGLWTQARLGYPKEEAACVEVFGPGLHGHGVYRVFNSGWQEQIVADNRHRFPATADDLGLKHFRITFKENTLEVLASGMVVWSGIRDWARAFELYKSRDP